MSDPVAIVSLRGGLDDTSPPTAMAPDACRVAENVEFVDSTCGERRAGCTPADLGSFFSGYDAVVWMFRHLPTTASNETDAQLWALAQDLTAPYAYKLGYRDETGWHEVTLSDALDATPPNGHRISAASLHGKLFLAYKSSVNRLHVWDGSSVRRVGLAEPAAPVVANSGAAGTYATTRYVRVRFTKQDGSGTTLLRSEPSETTTHTPSGAPTGALVTRPALLSEGETHWEVEFSLDNGNFYRVATVVIATTTYTDTTAAGTGYNTPGNELSEDIEDYALIPSVTLLSVDEDRLIAAGSYEEPAQASRVNWTPVLNNPGVGNDERLETDTDPSVDLDGYEGGGLTTLGRATNGYLYVEKRSHTHRLVRQGVRTKAYQAVAITKSIGALPGSMVEAIDQAGKAAQYMLDPTHGPYRQGAAGLQWCGRDIQKLWKRVNANAIVPCFGVYYSTNRQVHWWVALDDADYPNAKIVLHVSEMRDTDEGARRGWATVPVDDRIADAHCATMFSDNLDSTDPRTLTLVPFIGGEDAGGDLIQQCDTGTDDNGTAYVARVRSKPFMPGGLLRQANVMSAALLCKAVATSNAEISVNAIRDFGADTLPTSTDMAAAGSEEDVIKVLDDLSLAELWAVQFEIGDLADDFVASNWEVNALICKMTDGKAL